MTKKERLQALIDYYSSGSKAQFSRKLGISPQGISTWLARDTFDVELVSSKCEEISPMWLLRGVGEMLLPDPVNTQMQIPGAPSYLLDMIKEKDLLIQRQAEELGKLREQLSQLRKDYEIINAKKIAGESMPQTHAQPATVT